MKTYNGAHSFTEGHELPKDNNVKTGIEQIAQERKEQLEKHGRTVEKDVEYNSNYQLREAAELLIQPTAIRYRHTPEGWNEEIWQHMCNKGYTKRLAIAGALIAAEIDRVNAIIKGE